MRGDEYLVRELKELFGNAAAVVAKQGIGGGCINQTSLLELSDGRKVFLKENSSSYPGLFESEAAGLEALREGNGPAVPHVYGFTEGGGRQYLLLEYIEEGRKRDDFWEDFGRSLAALHRASGGRRYGFERDNFIGATPQLNRWEESWPVFFAQHRIGYQLDLARRNGFARERWFAGAERLGERLVELLPEPGHPSVLHGDLWGGNYMVGSDGRTVLIDPAVYFGHREADLAMTELFGGFGSRFYDAYNEVFPIEPGYRERKGLYNLYHLLNHLNLFGAAYAGSVSEIVGRYA